MQQYGNYLLYALFSKRPHRSCSSLHAQGLQCLEQYLYLFPKFTGNYPRVQTNNCKNITQIISN